MQLIFTSEVSTPAGHYAQAEVANGTVYASDILLTLDSSVSNADSVEAQVHSALRHCEGILAAGSLLNQPI